MPHLPQTVPDWANWMQILGGAALLIALWQVVDAARNARSAARNTRGQFLLQLDQTFEYHRDTRKNIRTVDWEPSGISQENEVKAYLAIFERIGMLLNRRSLNCEDVDQFYGDRFAKLIGKQYVQKIILDKPKAWFYVIVLWEQLLEYNSKKGGREIAPRPVELCSKCIKKFGIGLEDEQLIPEVPDSGETATT